MFLFSLLDKILRFFGSSERQLKWKLHLRRRQREARQHSRKNVNRHIAYRHKLCDSCGEIVDRDAKACPHCEAPVAAWGVKLGGKLFERLVPGSGSATSLLLIANGGLFVVAVAVTGTPWSMGGYTGIHFGANYGPLMTAGGEWWRLVSYNFVHVGGAFHIGFNLYALAIVGPMVEQWYGSARAVVIFVATGIFAGIVSHLMLPWGASGGASGAVLGLIGAGVVAGHVAGDSSGLAMRNGLLRWFLFIVLFGLLVPGIDNGAHIGGFVSGVLLGLGLGSQRKLTFRENLVFRSLAAASLALCAVSVALALVNYWGYPATEDSRTTRSLWRDCEEVLSGDDLESMISTCDLFANGDAYYAPTSETIVRAGYEARLLAALYVENGQDRKALRMLRIWESIAGLPQEPLGDLEAEIELCGQVIAATF